MNMRNLCHLKIKFPSLDPVVIQPRCLFLSFLGEVLGRVGALLSLTPFLFSSHRIPISTPTETNLIKVSMLLHPHPMVIFQASGAFPGLLGATRRLTTPLPHGQ